MAQTTTTNDKVNTAIERLDAGLAKLGTDDNWRAWLRTQAQFHTYSANNATLIALQMPEATQVAGFHTWRKLGRWVLKGETGITILAPVTLKTHGEDSGEITPEDDGTGSSRFVVGFRAVTVFDVSQTDGAELPTVGHRLTGDDPDDVYTSLCGVAHSIGYTVEEDYLGEGVNGDCTHRLRRIRIEVRNDPAQQVKTLAHEIGHALLHDHTQTGTEQDAATCRGVKELEAESVAYVVTQALGFESGSYSFSYVANWSGGDAEARAALKSSTARIAAAARQILTAYENVATIPQEHAA